MNAQDRFTIELPPWCDAFLAARPASLCSDEQGMALAIELALENVRQASGGPFAALVVDQASGQLVSAGVNLVTRSGLSIAHAEIVALSLAQRRQGDWNLASGPPLTLITTCEPCAMCFGAVPWSGVAAMVCGARKQHAEQAGFDEGDKPGNWQDSLHQRGIDVRMDVLADSAAAIFDAYLASGGEIYNAGKPGP